MRRLPPSESPDFRDALRGHAFPGIDNQRTHGREIGDVASHHPKSVAARGGGDEAIGNANLPPVTPGESVEFTPQPGYLDVHHQDSVGKVALKTIEPSCKLAPPPTWVKAGHASGDFTEGDNAKKRVAFGKRRDGSLYCGCAFAPTDLRHNASVEENFHRAGSRMGVWSRSTSTPSKDGPLIR